MKLPDLVYCGCSRREVWAAHCDGCAVEDPDQMTFDDDDISAALWQQQQGNSL